MPNQDKFDPMSLVGVNPESNKPKSFDPMSLVGVAPQKKNPNLSQSNMASSGETSSTDSGEETAGWLSGAYSLAKGLVKQVPSFVAGRIGGLLELAAPAAQSELASGYTAMSVADELAGKRKPFTPEEKKFLSATSGEMVEGTYQEVNKIKSKLLPEASKGTSDIFALAGKGRVTNNDMEAIGATLGDTFLQQATGAIPVVGQIVNFAGNFEGRYDEARKMGISPDKALGESLILAGVETEIERRNGVDKMIASGFGKKMSREAIEEIGKKVLTREAFEETVAKTAKALSWENIKTGFIKGAMPEFLEEFAQSYIDVGEKKLFDLYERKKKEDDPNAKLELYDPKNQEGLLSGKTFLGALNAGFWGGLTGQMGGMFVDSRSFNPSIYSTLQNAYDSQGKEGLNSAIEEVRNGLTKASESNKLSVDSYNNALKNVDKIANNISKFDQKSDIDNYARYSLFNIDENIVPAMSNDVAKDMAKLATPIEMPTPEQIDNDIANGDVTTVSYDQLTDVPDAYRSFAGVGQDQEGNKVLQFDVPNSLVKAYTDNEVAVQTLMNSPLFAIKSLTDNNREITVEDLERIGLGGGAVFPSSAEQLQFKVKFEQNKPKIINQIKTINYLKSVSNNIKETGKAPDALAFNNGLNNIYKYNTGDTVFYNNTAHKILETSSDGQKLKLSGIQEQVNASDSNLKTQKQAQEDTVAQPTATNEAEQAQPEQVTPTAEETTVVPTVEEETEDFPSKTIGEAVYELTPFVYQGKTGRLRQQSNGTVLFETKDRDYELGNIADLKDAKLSEWGIVQQEMSTDKNFSVTIDGRTFTNKNQNPFAAITYDENGDAVSVKLQDDKGKTKTIKGARALLIDAQYKERKILNESTDEQLNEVEQQVTTRTEDIGNAEQAPTGGQVKPVEPAFTEKQRERQRAINEVAKRLAQQSENMKNTNEAIANITSSLFTAGINVEVLTTEQIKAKYGSGQTAAQGFFISEKGVIVINKNVVESEWGKSIVFHEATHPIINIIRNADPKAFKQLIKAIRDMRGDNATIDSIIKSIEANPNYKGQFTQDDEIVVETIARIASGKLALKELTPSLSQKIKDLINKIGKVLGFKQVLRDNNDVAFVKLANQISDVLNAGRDIAEIVGAKNVTNHSKAVQKYNLASSLIESKNEAFASGDLDKAAIAQASSIARSEEIYSNKEVSNIPTKSLTQIFDEYNGKAVFINSDPTRVGEHKLTSGKSIFLYGGGDYNSLKDNVDNNIGFATTQIGKVETYNKLVKNTFGENKGVTLIVEQAPTSVLSNSYTLRSVLDAISQLPKSVRDSPKFKMEFFGEDIVAIKDAFGAGYDSFMSKYKSADFGSKDFIDELVSELAYKFGEINTPSSFKARRIFVQNLTAGIVEKSTRAGFKDEKGWVSKEPKKFIAKNLFNEFGMNQESLMRSIARKEIVDSYFDNGDWGFVVSGFESSTDGDFKSIQDKGVVHPLFNAKFYGEKPFKLESFYKVDDIVPPTMMFESADKKKVYDKPYEKRASLMSSASIYYSHNINQELNEYGVQMSNIDRDYTPEGTVADAGMTMAERQAWKDKNKVNQKQKRNPIVQQTAKALSEGFTTFEEYVNVVRNNMPINPFKDVPKLPSLKEVVSALDNGKLSRGGIVGVNRSFNDGDKVATRLDIPAYEDYDTWVVSIHDQFKEGKVLAYGQTAVLKNVVFKTSAKGGIGIAIDKDKTTIARMFGDWSNEAPESAHKRATELMNDPAWTQVGMNPFRHSFFYDKSNGEPLLGADEVIQVGALVLAKNVKRAPIGSEAFKNHFTFVNKVGQEIQFSNMSRGDKRINALRDEYYNNDVPADVLIEAAKKEYGLDQEAAEALVAKATGSVLDLAPYETDSKAELGDEKITPEVQKILDEYTTDYENDKKQKLAKESKKTTFADIAVKLYDSKFKIRRILQSLSDMQTLSSAKLRNIMGKAKASSMEAQQAIARIYGGLSESQIKIFDQLNFALRVIQVDKNNNEKVYKEYDNLRKQFIKENNGKMPNEKQLEDLMEQARSLVPNINHGLLDNTRLYTAADATKFIDKLRNAYSTEDFDNLMSRAAEYKKVGNESVAKMLKAGMISQEVADKYKDDFYSFRKTLERYYDDYSSNVPIYYKDGVAYYSAFKSLGEGSKESYFQRDSRVLLAENILIVNKAIAKNDLRKSIFNDIMISKDDFFDNPESTQRVIRTKEGGDLSFAFKPAVYARDKDGKVKKEASGYVVEPAQEGFVNVPFRTNGSLQYFQMEKELYDEVEGLNTAFNPQDSNLVMQAYYGASNAANKVLTASQTRYNPLFFWRNMSMDIRHQVHFTDYWTSDKNFLVSNVYSAYGRLLFKSIANTKKIFANDENMVKLLEEATEVGLFMDTYSEAREQIKRSSEIDTYAVVDGKPSKWDRFKTGVAAMNVKTEIAMRVSAYEQAKKHLTEEYKKLHNVTDLNEAQLEEIKEIASAQARGYTDFAQKGTVTPQLNYAYLNASIQGLGSAIEYSYDNPAKTLRKTSELFVGHMIWTTMLMMAIPDLYDELDEYTKDIYMLSPTGFAMKKIKDSLGLPSSFIPASKIDPTLVPIMGIARRTAEHFVKSMRGEKTEPITYEETARLINIALPSIFALPEKTAPLDAAADWGSKILSGSSLLSGGTKLFFGYDAFRGKDIDSKNPNGGSNSLDGMYDSQIPYIYKVMSKAAALATGEDLKAVSPARINAAAESFIGSPKSSFLTGVLTAIASDVANIIIPAADIEKSEITIFNPKTVMKSFGVITDSGMKERVQNKKFMEESHKLNMKAADIETIADKNIDLFYKENPATFMSRVEKYAEQWDYAGDEDATERLFKKAELKLNKLERKSNIPKDLSTEVKIIYYTKGTDNQAKMLKSIAGDDKRMANRIIESLYDFGMDESKMIEIEDKYYQK